MIDAMTSIVFPVLNLEKEIEGILCREKEQTENLNTEFIIVDMGSSDRTILKALQLLSELHLRGSVVQNGKTTVSSALNTGIMRAGGTYITFLFARRLYKNYLPAYVKAAGEGTVDLVFGTMSQVEMNRLHQRKHPENLFGIECVRKILEDQLPIDISAIFLRKAFLLEQQIYLNDECSFGYSEEFLLRCFLSAGTIREAPVLLTRDRECELHREKQKNFGEMIFQRISAMERILEILETEHGNQKELIALFRQKKLPQTVINCVDILLREKLSHGAILTFLKKRGYYRYLKTGKYTPKNLQKQIFIWKRFPKLYRPQKQN
ncbi:MAG: glycosyltransferase [Clostridiales bacterium]|jgi:glycosyltransferase involved in cell wall biosynthesis|nr:glycosyltransferase [Clostridiales bacterium]MCI2161616.1 glycosyltransferase [Oscillospiraceae bacterium]CAB1248602.1 Glycosyltransferase family 2 protein [Ruminococcaceae bacterium BL-4]MCI1960346.1 glycosyltransferase [Clostridiales bacterium]MCI2020833.1 glycosyltransferase [Clostridiales bacterium]